MARLLNSCSDCHLQYDVSNLDVGSSVLCECGSKFTVKHIEPRPALAMRCSHCGGVLVPDAKSCGYCSAEITLEARRLSEVCPECFSRMLENAHFCMRCGIAIKPQARIALKEDQSCPACDSMRMRIRVMDEVQLTECGACGGIWLGVECFDMVCVNAERNTFFAPKDSASPIAILGSRDRHYVRCLKCEDFMTQKNFGVGSGVVIDYCQLHGVWLDAGELQALVTYLRAGGLGVHRQHAEARTKVEAQRSAGWSGSGEYTSPAPRPFGWHSVTDFLWHLLVD